MTQLLREVGILLIAFAPLDAVLAADRQAMSEILLMFFLLGLSLFSMGVVVEWRMPATGASEAGHD